MLPCVSASTWISMWRGLTRYCSTYIAPLPNALSASALARSPISDGLPVHSHELNDLFLLRRTWAGKRMALRLAGRILSARLGGRDLVSNGAALQGRLLEIALREG